jgi:two-component system sensor histidine kinase VicK
MVLPDMTISLHQALETLSRLQSAAPEPTASHLSEIGELLQALSEENTYLNALLVDGITQPGPPRVEAPPPPPEPPAGSPEQASMAESWLVGMGEALRPPLVAIRGRAELVQAGLLGQISPEQDQWLQAIQENTDRAFGVMDAIQELMSLHKGQMRIEKVNFISTDLLKEAWERIRDQARALNHEITIQAPDSVPLAHGDFYHSLIILTDLLDNALHYTPPGGQIRMSVDDLGTHVLFTVADNGIGLTPEEMDFIGQPFWRGSHRMVRQHSGSGLRLHLAKQVLAQLDGELIFSGEPALGSTFSFTLPIPE